MFISFVVMFTFQIGLAYVIAYRIDVGAFGTWIATFIDWYVRSVPFVYRYFSNK